MDGCTRRACQRRWLEVYAERFDTVEVNTTFYRLPRREAVAAWAEQTPADFAFAVKASRLIEFRHESWFTPPVMAALRGRRIAQWRRRADVYAYFDNDWNGYAPANAAELIKRLSSE